MGTSTTRCLRLSAKPRRLASALLLAASLGLLGTYLSLAEARGAWSQQALLLSQGDASYNPQKSDELYEQSERLQLWYRRCAVAVSITLMFLVAVWQRPPSMKSVGHPNTRRLAALTIIDGWFALSIYLGLLFLSQRCGDVLEDFFIYGGVGFSLCPTLYGLGRGRTLGGHATHISVEVSSAFARMTAAGLSLIVWPMAMLGFIFGLGFLAAPHLVFVGGQISPSKADIGP